MAVSSRSSRRPRAATAARASCASMAVMGPTSANLSWSSVMGSAARALRSCEPQQLGGRLGNPVHRAVANDAEAGLEPAKEPVPAREWRVVLGREMAVLEEQRERLRRAGGADPGIGGAVCELEELHSELHVDEAAAAQLGIVPAGGFVGNFALHALTHRQELLGGRGAVQRAEDA